jgi:hypothetical protein
MSCGDARIPGAAGLGMCTGRLSAWHAQRQSAATCGRKPPRVAKLGKIGLVAILVP